jgi:hypothetical protein
MIRPLCYLLILALAACHPGKAQSISTELTAALAAKNSQTIQTLVQTERLRLGDRAGTPEVADTYQKVPPNTPLLDPAIAQLGFSPHFTRLKQLAAPWKPGLDPTTLTEPLRAPASIISGCTAIAKANLQGSTECLTLANQTADFLLWAQEQAGAGCFPFPAARGTSEARAMQVATRFLDRAEKAGKLAQTVRNGWAFEDHGDGGLQFDNAECALALFDLHHLTQDPRHLAAALKAADWALSRPLCTNWNYNAFSVHLLAKAHAVTQNPHYLDAAVQKALLGVIPGQLTDGPLTGRWLDPHNARPAYHYIMMSALAQLTATLPPNHPDRPAILTALRLGLTTRNAEFTSQGVMTKDKAIESLLLVSHLFQNDPAFLESTHTTTALHTLSQLVSEEARRGKLPLSPSGWGQFLAHMTSLTRP